MPVAVIVAGIDRLHELPYLPQQLFTFPFLTCWQHGVLLEELRTLPGQTMCPV